MRPEAPLDYRPSLLERLGLAGLLSPTGRMVVRGMGRRPARAALGTLGLATAVAVLVVAAFMGDAIELMVQRQLGDAQRWDLSVTFTGPAPEAALAELRAIPGVRAVEPQRAVAAVLRRGHRSARTPLLGVEPGADLTRLVGAGGEVVPVPPAGLVLSRQLAQTLGAVPGDEVVAEVTEGRRPVLAFRLAGTVDDLVGVTATLSRHDLGARLGEPGLVTGAALAVDPARAAEVQARVARLPRVLAATSRAATLAALRGMLDELLLTYTAVIFVLAAGIAAGVAYNTGRIAWAERERELATLRVIGLTRGEAWRLLAGELAALLLGALPLGMLLGAAFVAFTAAAAGNDLFRLPAVVSARTFAVAALITTAAVGLVALAARRWVSRLDLVASLSTRE
jgi:putative ABC transport system permease protein